MLIEVVIISLIDEKCTWIEGVLPKTSTTKAVNCLKIPASGHIDLAVAGLQKQHAGVFICTQESQRFRWQLYPQLSVLFTPLQEGGAHVSGPGGPVHGGGQGQQHRARQASCGRTRSLNASSQGVGVSKTAHDQSSFRPWRTVRVPGPLQQDS